MGHRPGRRIGVLGVIMSGGNGATRSISTLARALGVPLLALTLALSAALVAAQALDPPPESVLRVAKTDGAPLNLRANPSTTAAIVAELSEGELLTVTGVPRTVEDVRWLPVRSSSGQTGWVAAQYTIVLSMPPPPIAAAPPPVPSPEPVVAGAPRSETTSLATAPAPKPAPVDIDVHVKYPEARAREQELEIWVTRDGAPVRGAIVYVKAENGDDEVDRILEATDADGHTRRVFTVKKEKGTVYLTITAVAPDGGEGHTTASFFRR